MSGATRRTWAAAVRPSSRPTPPRRRRIEDRLAVDPDPSGPHELLSGAARRHARDGEVLGQTHRAATIVNVNLDLLDEKLSELGQPAYRARQIWRWASQGAGAFDAMT